ncbi:MAG: hypothetical protein AMJ60_07280 [Desulfobacterales bacterium SG8_35]|nr:MAG: hypothetical protein AMJ60_07280 [Desulfobacterales bacterium SG8_35]
MSRKNCKTVLVVGDDPKISDILAEQESAYGCKPILAANGEEAFRIALQHPPVDFLYADLMLDNGYTMPEINGVDFARAFIKLYPKTDVLYMIL